MGSERRAVAGLGLVAAAQVTWLPLVANHPVMLGMGTLQVVGMALAAIGLARGFLGRGLLAGGLLLYALGTGAFLFGFLTGDVSAAVQGFTVLGAVLAAWAALLWAFDPTKGAARAYALRVAFAVSALPQLLWLPYDVAAGSWPWMAGNVLAFAGFALAARSLAIPTRPTAPAAGAAAPAGAGQSKG